MATPGIAAGLVSQGVIDLLELLRQLIQRSSEMKGEYFDKFVQPSWDKFSEIHNDYKSSITKYVEHLAEPDFSIEELVKTIRQDSIVTDDIRAELEVMIETMPENRLEVMGGSKLLYSYIRSIADYFIMDKEVRSRINIEKNMKITGDIKSSVSNELLGTTVTIGNSKKIG